MMQHLLRIMLSSLLALAMSSASSANADEWGSIEGQFIAAAPIEVPVRLKAGGNLMCAKTIPDESLVVNSESRGIANVFIYLRKAPAKVHPNLSDTPTSQVTSDQANCLFLPHAMMVRTGQTINCINSDKLAHNLHTNPVIGTAQNFILQPEDQVGQNIFFERPETLPVKVVCDIHSWMDCYWLVLDHPYMAVTDADGKFKIENLPVGEHSFRVWHERQGYLNREYKVTVAKDKLTALPVEVVPIEKLSKK